MAHEVHREQAKNTPVRCAILTVSDTRTETTDVSGAFIREALSDRGLSFAGYRIVPDEPTAIRDAIEALLEDAEAVLITGGTGISRRDTTFEVVDSLLDRRLPGFGEIFRMLSFQEIGPAAMLSRASAGVVKGRLVFSMPGSTAAVRLAMEELILPDIQHLVWECVRQGATHN
ncbi:MAG: molybdenum cofactor biosynthesis protein B [Rhodothermales bacterium]|nr:molybdenum cofactor biosynthesis protein B [Rhodothermales bacterium]